MFLHVLHYWWFRNESVYFQPMRILFNFHSLNISISNHCVWLNLWERVNLSKNWFLTFFLSSFCCVSIWSIISQRVVPLGICLCDCSLLQRARVIRKRRKMMTFPRTGSFPRAPCCPRSLPPPSKACWKFCVTNLWVKKKVPPIFIYYIETDDIVILLLINIFLLIFNIIFHW